MLCLKSKFAAAATLNSFRFIQFIYLSLILLLLLNKSGVEAAAAAAALTASSEVLAKPPPPPLINVFDMAEATVTIPSNFPTHHALPFRSPIILATSAAEGAADEVFLVRIRQSELSNAFSLSKPKLHAGEQFDVILDNSDTIKNIDHIKLHIEAEPWEAVRNSSNDRDHASLISSTRHDGGGGGAFELFIHVAKEWPKEIFDRPEYRFDVDLSNDYSHSPQQIGSIRLINGATVDRMRFSLFGAQSKYFTLRPNQVDNTVDVLWMNSSLDDDECVVVASPPTSSISSSVRVGNDLECLRNQQRLRLLISRALASSSSSSPSSPKITLLVRAQDESMSKNRAAAISSSSTTTTWSSSSSLNWPPAFDVAVNIAFTNPAAPAAARLLHNGAPKFVNAVQSLRLREKSTLDPNHLVIMDALAWSPVAAAPADELNSRLTADHATTDTSGQPSHLRFNLNDHQSVFDIDPECAVLSVINAQEMSIENFGEHFNVSVQVTDQTSGQHDTA
ncbi:unnamed protein product, partial [Anisakis simplex]|uniref:Cadherin domain-containing protein n=1 Tax=Anisakis simplex TaxID=6269 RepID=A0A0M3IZJ4_ANISI